jgi:hypothetical protein
MTERNLPALGQRAELALGQRAELALGQRAELALCRSFLLFDS